VDIKRVKKMDIINTSSFSTRKVWILLPQSLFDVLRASGHFYRDFDDWGCTLFYNQLVAEGFIEAPEPPKKVSEEKPKKPRKKAVAEDEAI
jgi:hypothetical protein